MTIVGKETTHEVFRKDQDFSFREGFSKKQQILNHLIYRHAANLSETNEKIVKEFVSRKLTHLISRLQKNIIKAIDLCIGECVEPKVIHDPRNTLADIIAIPAANIVVACIEKRLYDKKRLGDAWVAPLDALQCHLNDPAVTPDLDPNNVNYDYIVDSICRMIFSAMVTTSNGASSVLYDLVKRKQHFWQELYQEAQEINKQCNGNELTIDDIARMIKLDSFVKESLRFLAPIVGIPHKCISKSCYTFANGYQIPSDEELQGQNPTEFRAYRHLERNSPATKLERNYLSFGGGKHACPGRTFAVNQIKIYIHKILLKYDVRTNNKEIESKRRYFGPFSLLVNVDLVFENRKEIVN
ncbi:cytochrome P450 [Gigaspora rosea]|uniref:Cytochrome P450 n=1 Tax=Gigaspora rosea TaxID=44941 RepID=A0A397W6S2_9GLOM|nr:cytochrome P450 [Gigaspora rosea]